MSTHAVPARLLRAAASLLMLGLLGSPARAEEAGVVVDGGDGPGKGKHVVLIAADDEYRSEELIPQLAKILARRQGFKCTVLFAVDADGKVNPARKDHIRGLEALKAADLLILFARFRELPDDEMKQFVDYLDSGKPLISLRTSTHAFNYAKHKDSPYARYSYNSKEPAGGFGREVVGETWISHYGQHQKESTRGLVATGMENHPIVRGVEDIWGPSDVYGLRSLSGDSKPVIMGQVLTGMEPTDKPNPSKDLVPVAWIKTYTGPSGKVARIFTTTMGHAGDLKNEGFRRLLVNATYWSLGMEDRVPAKADVALVGKYDPLPIGDNKHRRGLTPEQFVNGEGDR
jgi:Trehalose utilisation